MDFSKFFKRKNLPWIGLCVIIIVAIGVVMYKNKKDCELKKLARVSVLAQLTSDATELEFEIVQTKAAGDQLGLNAAIKNHNFILQEIEDNQKILNTLQC